MKQVMMWAMANMVFRVALFSALLSVSCQASTNVTVNAPRIVFTQVARDKSGQLVNSSKPIPYIPIHTPSDGIGKGPPIFYPPTPAFQMSFAGKKVQATLLEANHILTMVQTRPPFFKEESSGLTVRLNRDPSDDKNVVKHIKATVSLPEADISDSVYACKETAICSSIFAHDIGCMEMTINTPSNSQPAKVDFSVFRSQFTAIMNHSLTQDSDNTFVFTDGAVSVRLLDNLATNSVLVVAVTAKDYGFSNTVMQFKHYNKGGRSVYQNYAPSTPTNVPHDPVPLDVAFYVEVCADDLGDKAKQPVVLMMETDKGDVQIGQVSLTPVGKGVWQSVKPVVICVANYKPSEIMPSDLKSYLFLRASATAIPGGKIEATIYPPNRNLSPSVK